MPERTTRVRAFKLSIRIFTRDMRRDIVSNSKACATPGNVLRLASIVSTMGCRYLTEVTDSAAERADNIVFSADRMDMVVKDKCNGYDLLPASSYECRRQRPMQVITPHQGNKIHRLTSVPGTSMTLTF